MEFINRENELKTLENEYKKKGSSFVIIYGRRRTGKTTLIQEFIKTKPHIYFLADLQNEKLQIERLKNIIAETFKKDFLKSIEINDWQSVFNIILENFTDQSKLIIAIDEFQYLAKINKANPSIFQNIWDNILKNKNIMLILCGSITSLMYKFTLNYSSPLYGRRTAQIKLQSMNFFEFKKFFKIKDNDRLLQFYSIAGGIPKYIEFLDENLNVFENIKEKILNKNSFLYEEPKFILKDEIKEPVTYFSILQVISLGEYKIGKIASKLGIDTKNLTSFMEKLIDLEIIERIIPVTEEKPHKSKKGLYFIKDNFFNFWFRFVFPYQSYIEAGNVDFVIDKIKQDFSQYVSFVFEKVCLDYIKNINLPFQVQKYGKWWDKNEEIDIIVIGENEILFGECKYWNNIAGVNVFKELIEKSEKVKVQDKNLKKFYAICSKKGFSRKLIKLSKNNENLMLFSLKNFFIFQQFF